MTVILILIGVYLGINMGIAFVLLNDGNKWYKALLAVFFGAAYVVIKFLYTILSSIFYNFLYWRNIRAIINMRIGKYDNLAEHQIEMTKNLYASTVKQSPGIGKTLDLIFLNGIIERNGIEIAKPHTNNS